MEWLRAMVEIMPQAKRTITINLHNNGTDFIGEPIYLTGNMVDWKVDGLYVGILPPKGESLRVDLEHIDSTQLEFKINRGSWHTLTASKDGFLLPPYVMESDTDASLDIYIDAWRDTFPKSTASSRVSLLADSFYFKRLDSYKRIWIYLPIGYEDTLKKYPVLYMHDGQHVFDESTSLGRMGPVEWQVDKSINRLNGDAIVVAIEHALPFSEREKEYMIFPTAMVPEPLGRDYLQDIVETLKPYVDLHYRTLSEKPFTAMAGSSLAGLLALEAGLLYPDVFGYLGVFSPSIWTAKPAVFGLLNEAVALASHGIGEQGYFYYAGGMEKRASETGDRPRMLTDMLEFTAAHREKTTSELIVDIDDRGKHGALYWQKVFPRFFESWQRYVNR